MQRVQVCDLGIAGRTLSVSRELEKVDILLSSNYPALKSVTRARVTVGDYGVSQETAQSVPSTTSTPTTTLLARVFSDAPERVDTARFFIEVLQLPTEKAGFTSKPGKVSALVQIGRLRELTLHRSVMDAHAFACLFSALPSARTLESLCLEEPNDQNSWKLPKLECAWLAYAIFHPLAATSSWRRLELRNCDPFCIDEAIDLPPDRKVEILSVMRLVRLQRNKKRKRADRRAAANAPHRAHDQAPVATPVLYEGTSLDPRLVCVRAATDVLALPDTAATRLLVLAEQTWLEASDLQTRQWVCVLVPGFGLGWVRRDAVKASKPWTPGVREEQYTSTPSLVPSLTSLKLRGECLSIKRTQSLVRALGPSLESLELKTGRMYSCLLQEITKACPRLRALLIKTKLLKLKGSALRDFFSDVAVACHLRSLTLNWGICNPRVLLDILSTPTQYPVANALEELHLCYVSMRDYFEYHTGFVNVLCRNLVLERLYLSGSASFESITMLCGFSGKIVAYEKTAAPSSSDRPGVFRNLSADLLKLIFAFGLTQRVVGTWPSS